MYKAEDLKSDLIANMAANPRFLSALIDAIESSQFEFIDTSTFSGRTWNKYTRILNIFCRTADKAAIDKEKKSLYDLCVNIHGIKDEHEITELNVFIKASLDEVLVYKDRIIISKKVVIDKEKDFVKSGGFSRVYKKEDEQIDMAFGYKIFDPSPFQQSSSEIMKKRFIREAKKMMSYSHENIVHAYDFGFLGDESAYIKMEYVDGSNLLDYVKGQLLNDVEKERLAHQYISAMAYIHSKADVHRDLSFSNVMVTKEGIIKVLDFGFARNNDDTTYDTEYNDILHKFNPPDSKYDIRTEIFCIGAILFAIFSNDDFHITKLSQLDSVCAENKFKIAIKRCLEIDPNNRFQSAIELQDFLLAEIQKKETVNMNSTTNFSLDEFKEIIDDIMDIQFYRGDLPTLSIIKRWVEIIFEDFILRHRFLSKINIITLLMQIPNVKKVSKYKNVIYEKDKKIIIDIHDAYNRFDDIDKTYLIEGIHAVIISKSIEQDFFAVP